MSGSYRGINYSLRPAKNVERKMMFEALRRLDRFRNLTDYRYVGFGSPFFADFGLAHRDLGLGELLSIEKESGDKQRFEFNKPYNCITMRYGDAKDAFGKVRWNAHPHIAWADYESTMDKDVLTAIDIMASQCASGSVLIVTVNAQVGHQSEVWQEKHDELTNKIGSPLFPRDIKPRDLREWGTANALHRVFRRHVDDILYQRNAGRDEADVFESEELFRFHYEDGARMLTIGELFYRRSDSEAIAACSFKDFDFCREENRPFFIRIPSLTSREILYLEAQLPCTPPDQIDRRDIPLQDVKTFAEIYRYFPKFAEMDF